MCHLSRHVRRRTRRASGSAVPRPHAGGYGEKVIAFTFSYHPAELFTGTCRYLNTLEQRISLLKENGADEVWTVPFTEQFAALSPESFLRMLLNEKPVKALVAGFNYTFGKKGSGTVDTLRAFGKALGYHPEIVEPVLFQGEPVSSTRIRNSLLAGEADKAAKMLTRPYILTGTVISNQQIGRSIGFPTANLDTGKLLLPMDGVYASEAVLADGSVFPSVTNIGTNPTVSGKKRTVETHLIGFSGDLYSQTADIRLLRYLRGEVAFPDTKALSEQIARDVEATLKLHES